MTDFHLETKLEDFSQTPEGEWLNNFDYKNIKIVPLNINIEGLCTAYYSALSNSVKVSPDKDDAVYFGSVIHLLYHAYQCNQYGKFKYLLKKTFMRKSLLKPAKLMLLKAVLWYCNSKLA